MGKRLSERCLGSTSRGFSSQRNFVGLCKVLFVFLVAVGLVSCPLAGEGANSFSVPRSWQTVSVTKFRKVSAWGLRHSYIILLKQDVDFIRSQHVLNFQKYELKEL